VNIDERLERLTERHEALTQTVEIVAAMQRENAQKIAELVKAVAGLVEIARRHEERLDRLDH
jgi:hypothetical protein